MELISHVHSTGKLLRTPSAHKSKVVYGVPCVLTSKTTQYNFILSRSSQKCHLFSASLLIVTLIQHVQSCPSLKLATAMKKVTENSLGLGNLYPCIFRFQKSLSLLIAAPQCF